MNTENQYSYAVSSDLKKNPKLSMAYSWPGIILLCILFLPIGIYAMYKRYTFDKTAMLKDSKNVSVIAYMLIAIGIIYLIMAFTVEPSTIIATVLFGVSGVYVLSVSKKMKKDGQKYKQYFDLIVKRNLTSIDNIAATVGVPYDVAITYLYKMIDYGFFPMAYIHEGNREFILNRHNPHPQNQATNSTAQIKTKVVACKSCGANNSVIIGQNCECEYCGSPIQ